MPEVRDTRPLRVVVADDHGVVRRSLRLLLEQAGCDVVADAADVPQAIEAVARTRPDILLLDLHMPGGRASEVLQATAARSPATHTLVLTVDDSPRAVRAALAAGAAGYVSKGSDDAELMEAIRQVHAGHAYVSPRLGASLVRFRGERLGTLSEEEVEVLRLVALGYTAREMADLMARPQRHVEWQRTRLQRALGAHNRADLVRVALEERLLEMH